MNLEPFLKSQGTILDVRSPSEFQQGCIPIAQNIPLFSDEERALVGTVYKEYGSKAAVELGKEFAYPKLDTLLSKAKSLTQKNALRVHCWRGGMRSEAFAGVLKKEGIQTITLAGGYKTFRRWVLKSFQPQKWEIKILGGLTGSGKTEKLHALKKQGEQILDLEALAEHRGSSFGAFLNTKQPSTEQFENRIAWHLLSLDPSQPIWIEDESRLIGTCPIPLPLFQAMQEAPLTLIETTLEERIKRLVSDYGKVPPEILIENTLRLQKRLGGARTQDIIRNIQTQDLKTAASLLLSYYDKSYNYSLKNRKKAPSKERAWV